MVLAVQNLTEKQYAISGKSMPEKSMKKVALEQIHWATTRRRKHDRLLAFAFDHRSQFVDMAQANGKSEADIDHFKMIALGAATRSSDRHQGVGLLVDDRLGRTALHAASDHDLWIGRPIEQ